MKLFTPAFYTRYRTTEDGAVAEAITVETYDRMSEYEKKDWKYFPPTYYFSDEEKEAEYGYCGQKLLAINKGACK